MKTVKMSTGIEFCMLQYYAQQVMFYKSFYCVGLCVLSLSSKFTETLNVSPIGSENVKSNKTKVVIASE
jgi:hypothetical protein